MGTSDDKRLLFQFPKEEYTSHFNVRIDKDEEIYSNDPFRTAARTLPLLSDPVKLTDGTITCSYQVGHLTIPFLTSLGYNFRRERQFTAPSIPDSFLVFENQDLTSPGLVAKCMLAGREAVTPDLSVIGEWTELRSVQWNYKKKPDKLYNDSAVLLRWNAKRLAPGERRIVATYYGIGEPLLRANKMTR